MDLTTDLIEFVILADIVNTVIGDIFSTMTKKFFNDNDSDNDTMAVEAIMKRATKKSKENVNAMKLFVKQFDKSM
jgi:hypothetical protein